ncbi:MAG TPA: ABC transporter permease [Pyrinomonadaceae bacterium]|nr:ABC transporter permease [Pyrinomonadaceae bacterium]
MINPTRTPFAAIFQNEVLLNSKRVAPYFMALLCAGNALLWWARGPARGRGWAVNADFFIAGALPVYSFMTLHMFTVLFMADPVTKDFRAGIDPLIFSKPISRAAYLLGKFFGNFFVLVCCQSAFVLTWFVLQAVPKQGVITLDWKAFPYLKHFLIFVVISHLGLAAFYFAVGALTRNAKIVYGIGVCFYPVYAFYQAILLKGLPQFWRVVLDPLVMNYSNVHTYNRSAEWLNQLVVPYRSELIIGRAMMILFAAICLTIVYARFAISERPGKVEKFSVLNLSTAAEGVYYSESSLPARSEGFEKFESSEFVPRVDVPEVARVNGGIRANVNKLIAALGVEFRLLRAERSVVVVMPLAIFLSILEVAFYNIPIDVSYSAAYASNTAKLLLIFLVGLSVFYTGEAMHRDREVRVESFLWSTPVPNHVLLLSKFLSTLLLTCGVILAVGLAAVVIQLLRSHTPIDLLAYFKVYGLILLPGTSFVIAFCVLANIVLRNKHVAYVFSIGAAVGLFYLYSNGYHHWLYNPMLYQIWNYEDLISPVLVFKRICVVAMAILCLALAHLFFQRRSVKARNSR